MPERPQTALAVSLHLPWCPEVSQAMVATPHIHQPTGKTNLCQRLGHLQHLEKIQLSRCHSVVAALPAVAAVYEGLHGASPVRSAVLGYYRLS